MNTEKYINNINWDLKDKTVESLHVSFQRQYDLGMHLCNSIPTSGYGGHNSCSNYNANHNKNASDNNNQEAIGHTLGKLDIIERVWVMHDSQIMPN